MKFLNDGKFALGLFAGIITCIVVGLATGVFGLGTTAVSGAIGVLLGGGLGAVPSFYSQWLSYTQIENQRVREYNEKRSALASNLQAKLLRSAAHVSHIAEAFKKAKKSAEASEDKRPSLQFYGLPLRVPELALSDDELYLAIYAIKGDAKLEFLTLQDEYNQLCELSFIYCKSRREALHGYLSLEPDLQTKIEFPSDSRAHINALILDLDLHFEAILTQSGRIMARLAKCVIDVTEGFMAMPEINSRLLRMDVNKELNGL